MVLMKSVALPKPGRFAVLLTLAVAGLALQAASAAAQFPTALDIGELPAGKTIIVTYQAEIEDPLLVVSDTVQDQGSFDGSNFTKVLTDDPDTGAPDDPTVTGLDQPIDLQVSKVDSADPVVAGSGAGNLTYTISMFNDGPGNGTNVTVSEALTLPPGVSIVSITPSTGAYAPPNDPNGIWTLDIANQATETLTVVLTVGASTAEGATVSDTATVTGADQDIVMPGDDSATEATTVTTSANLSIAKADGADPATAGAPLTYTVTVTNPGPSDAQNVVVTDTLPAEVSNAMTAGGCGEDPNGVPTCTLGTIAAGGSAFYTITVDVDSDVLGVITNTASVASTTSDPDTNDNTVMEGTTIQAEADLEISKSDDFDPIVAGTTLNYTIVVNNLGPSDATNVVVTETLPAGVTFVSTSGCDNDPGGVPTCNLGTIVNGGFDAFSIQVTVDPSTLGVITNTATVSSNAADPNSANDTAMEPTTVNGQADLSIAKTDDIDPATAGGSLTYTVTVSNAGPSDAQDVVVTDTLPPGVSNAVTVGCGEDPNGVPTCTLGTIAAGGSAMYTITVDIDADTLGLITNNASVASSTTDTNSGNDTTMEDTTIEGEADLSIAKADNIDPAIAGGPLTYTVTVSNAGPSDAQDVVVTDTLPAEVANAVTVGCAEDPAGVPTCTLGTIAAGGSAFYTITVDIDADTLGLITNNASVASSTADPDSGNDSVMEGTTIQAEADLAISKTDDLDPVVAGNNLIYTVTVDNSAGPSDATNVVVTETLPAGVAFVQTTGCAGDPNGVPTCSLGTIPLGQQKQFTVEVTVDPSVLGVITNTASVTSDAADPNAANDTVMEGTTVEAEADLSLAKTDDIDPILPNETLTYTLTVNNAGPSDATNVVVLDALPGVNFVQTVGCAEDPNGVPFCTLGTIPAGGSAQYTIEVTIPSGASAGTITNAASVTSDATDNNSANDDASEDTLVELADYGDLPDPLIATPGEYPTLVANDGARHIVPAGGSSLILGVVIDTEPDGQPSPAADADDATGAEDDEDGVVFTNSLLQGQTATLDVEVTGASGLLNAWIDFDQNGSFLDAGEQVFSDEAVSPGVNSLMFVVPGGATVGTTYARFRLTPGVVSGPETLGSVTGVLPSGRQPDGEVEDYAVTVFPPPVLSLTKDDGGTSTTPNGIIIYDLIAMNAAGAGTAVGVTLSDTVPAGTTFNAADSTGTWSCADGSPAGTPCGRSLPDIPGGGTSGARFSVKVLPVVPAGLDEVFNEATVEATNGPPAMASDTTPVTAQPDMAISKDDGGIEARPGDVVVYALDFFNNGNQDATGIVLTDMVPANTTFDGPGSTPGWSCSDGDPAGTVCTFAAGALAGGGGASSVAFAVEVDDPFPNGVEFIENTASVADDGANGADPNPGDNSDSDQTTILVEADLSIVKSDDVDPILPGETLTYTLVVENPIGPAEATNVTVTDTLPAGVTFVQTVGCDNDPAGVPACDLGTIPVGGMKQFTIEVTVDGTTLPGIVTNEVTVASDEEDPSTGDNTDTEDTQVLSADYGDAPDLPYPTLVASDGARHIVPLGGSTLFLGLEIDTEPDGQPSAGADEDDANGVEDDEDGIVFTSQLPVGQMATVDVTVTGAAGLLNAWVDFDQNGSFLDAGEQIFVDEPVVAGTQGKAFPVPGTATLGATYARFRLDAGGGLAPSGRVVDGEVEDYLVELLLPPNLSLDKDDAGATTAPGGVVVYTLLASNAPGVSTAIGVTLSDTVPLGTTFNQAASGGGGIWDCADGAPAGTVCTRSLPDLAGGASAGGLFAVTVDSLVPAGLDEIFNEATVDGANAAPATDSETTPLDAVPDMTIDKDDGGLLEVLPGDTFAYSLTYANVGDQGATGVVLTDTVPAETTSGLNPGWEVAPVGSAVPCDLQPAGTVCVFAVAGEVMGGGAGGTESFELVVDSPVTVGTTEISNTASVNDDGANGPDPAPADNDDSDTTPVNTNADLEVDKVAVLDPVKAGSVQIYEITVTNNGPAIADTVVLEDILPAEVLYLFAAPDCGEAAGTVTCELGNVEAGESVEVTVSVQVPADVTGTLGNTATASSDSPDPVPGNDGDSADAEVEAFKKAVVVPDVNGNESDDVAVVTGGSTEVSVSDSLTPTLISLTSLDPDLTPIDLALVADFGGTPAAELAVLAKSTTDASVEVHVLDAATGASLSVIPVEAGFEPIGLSVMADFGGAGPAAEEVAILLRRVSDGAIRVRIRDAATGELITSLPFRVGFVPLAVATVPDFAGTPSDEVAVLARRTSDGQTSVFVKDGAGGPLLSIGTFGFELVPLGLAVSPSVDGIAAPNGGDSAAADLVVLHRRMDNGVTRTTQKDASTNVEVNKVGFGNEFRPYAFDVIENLGATAAPEILFVGRRASDGLARAFAKDTVSKELVDMMVYGFGFNYVPLGGIDIPDVDGLGDLEIGVLGHNPADDTTRVLIRDGGSGVVIRTIGVP